MEEIIQVKCAAETEKVGYELAKRLEAGGKNKAFIALFGEMGVGKTAFVRGFASYFGIRGIKSPTYSIVNEHRGADTSIFHFDMYRVESEDDLLSIGFYDYLSRRGYCIVEWSENIDEFIPEDAIFVTISRTENPEFRTIEINEDFK